MASAVCTINDGQISINYVLERMNMKTGAQLEQGFVKSSNKYVRQSTRHSSETQKGEEAEG